MFLIFLTYMNNHGPVGFAIKSKRLHRANKAPWHVMMITNSCPGLVFPKQCLQCDHRGSLLSPFVEKKYWQFMRFSVWYTRLIAMVENGNVPLYIRKTFFLSKFTPDPVVKYYFNGRIYTVF